MHALDHNNPALVKAAEVARHLIRRPRWAVAYAMDRLPGQRSPLERALPWIPFDAITLLEQLLTPLSTVYELGSGGSTLFFAEHAGRVLSVESDEGWFQDVRQGLRRRGLTNVELKFEPACFDSLDSFEKSDFFAAVPQDGGADLVFIDSYDFFEGHPYRPRLALRAMKALRAGGVMVVDDSWRYPEVARQVKAAEVVTITGLGPGRRAPSSTDFLFFGSI